MRKFGLVIALLTLSVLAGCATTKRSSVAYRQDAAGSLSVWEADMSASVAYPNGQMCMQRALAVKTIDANATAKVSEAVLALAGVATTAAAQGQTKELVSLAGAIKETVALLTTTTERTAFLDLGMFYTCQMSANGSLTDTQTAEVLRVLSISAASIGSNASDQTLQQLLKDKPTVGDNVAVPKPGATATSTAAR